MNYSFSDLPYLHYCEGASQMYQARYIFLPNPYYSQRALCASKQRRVNGVPVTLLGKPQSNLLISLGFLAKVPVTFFP